MVRVVRNQQALNPWLWVTGGLMLSAGLQTTVLTLRALGYDAPQWAIATLATGGITLIMVGLAKAYRFKVAALTRLQGSEQYYRSLVVGLAEGVIVVDDTDRVHLANATAEAMLGVGGGLEGEPCVKAIVALREDGTPFPNPELPHRVAIRTGTPGPTVVMGLKRPDQSLVWAMVSARPLVHPGASAPHAAVVSCFDISEHRAAMERLRLQATALEAVANAVLVTDWNGRITFINPAFTRLTGFEPADVIGHSPRMLKSDRHQDSFYQQMWETITAGRPWAGELYNRRKDGSVYLEEMTITPVRTSAGEISSFVAVMKDISERTRHNEQIQFLATHDRLTGLPNRYALDQNLVLHVERARRGHKGALLLLDVDNFLLVNETSGYAGGDEVIRRLAELISQTLPAGAFLARVNGDEFAILLEDCSAQDALAYAMDLQTRVSDFLFRHEGRVFSLSISVGCALVDGSTDAGSVQSLAILALKAAQEKGKNQVVLYTSVDEPGVRQTGAGLMAARIRDALREDRLVLYFQPVVQIRTQLIEHYEVLVRKRTPDGEILLPNAFLPVAERYGLMPWIDRWVVERSAALLERHPDLRLFVNLSGSTLGDQSLLRSIEDRVSHSSISDRLTFEVTETAAIQDPLQVQRWIRSLRELGCRFALDDFGLGFSSLSHLRMLPADYIKIDRSFVHNLDSDPGNQALIRAICAVANTFGKQVVAEGVETEAVARDLESLGVDMAQGYLWGHPSPDLIGSPVRALMRAPAPPGGASAGI